MTLMFCSFDKQPLILRLCRAVHGFAGDRPTLENWAEKKGRDGLREYWRQRNVLSLDQHATGIFD